MNLRRTRKFRVVWKDGGSEDVIVDDEARRLYMTEDDWEIAAALACIGSDLHKVRINIKDVREL